MTAPPAVAEPPADGGETAPDDVGRAAATEAVDALAAAFGTYLLYPSPEGQVIYTRSIERLGALGYWPLPIGVGPGFFEFGEEQIVTERDGAERLAKLLFVHDIGELRLNAAVRVEDLTSVFEILTSDEEMVHDGGGAHVLVEMSGITSIRLVHRFATLEPEDEVEPDRDDRVDRLLELAADPERFAAVLVEEAGNDAVRLAERFVSWYVEIYERLDRNDVAGREEVVRAFVEAFFYLPQPFQVPLVARFLESKDDKPCQNFLDQFSGHELAGIAPQLDGSSHERLMSYARVALDTADGRPEELLALLQSASEVREARMAVARRVEQLIRHDAGAASDAVSGQWLNSLHEQRPDPRDDFVTALSVLRELFGLEHLDDRFRRLLRIWAGRVAMCIRTGDLAGANRWVEGVLTDPPVGPERRAQLEKSLAEMATPKLLEILVGHLEEEGGPNHDAALRLLETWGRPVADKLVERLSEEENPNRRRMLIDVLGSIARIDPEPLLSYLGDSRWYVVRNLAMILGKSGRPEVAGRVKSLMRHDDHRVRVEALRALPPLLGDASVTTTLAGLSDEHPRVRQASLALLRNSEHPRVEDALLAAFAASMDGEELDRLADVLMRRGSAKVLAGLADHANRRVLLSAGARVRREAARRALERPR